MEVLTEDLIKSFNKSKSRISQALSFLADKEYIERIYVQNLNKNGSRHKILITPQGLNIAEAILSEGLEAVEQNVLEALKHRLHDSSYSNKEKMTPTRKR